MKTPTSKPLIELVSDTGAEPITRTQEVLRQIRNLILSGTLGPGEQLTEIAMAQRIGVSRTPIHDALNTLAAEGLLIYLPNRGYVVRHFGVQEVLDAFDTRGTLEGMACRVMAERGLSSDLERHLEDILDRSRVALYDVPWNETSRNDWHALNLDFHFALIDATGNRHLMSTVRQLRRLPRIYDQTMRPRQSTELNTLYERGHSRVALAEHIELLGAIRSGQGTRAEFLMREHVWRNREVLRVALQATGATIVPDER